MTTTALKWKRERPGHYTARYGPHVFDVELVEPEDRDPRTPGTCWTCRLDWVPFDAGSTLREAKHWCEMTAANLPEVSE